MMEIKRVGVAGVLHEIFTAHLGGEWPESMDVDYPSHDRSPCWSEIAKAERADKIEARRNRAKARAA